MGGTSKTTQSSTSTQQGTATQNPWDQSLPALQGILGGINLGVPSYNPTGAETGALNTLQTNAANTPNYAPQATSLATDLMGGGTSGNTALMDKAYTGFMGQINPYLNPDYLDPTKSPGMSGVLDTIRNDVSNSVNSQFAGAGRDLSGLNTQTLARGIAQGEAVPLLNQYNANAATQRGAQDAGYNAGNTTAAGKQGLTQQDFNNRFQGLDVGINGVPMAQNAGANNVLQAGATARGLPLQNLGMLEGLTLPIAGLGGTTNTTGTGTGTQQGSYTMSPIQQAQGYANIFGKLFPMGL